MRTITLTTGHELGTNEREGGIFCRTQEGTWAQWAGNSQTPTFRTAQQFLRYLRKHYDGFENATIVESRF